MARYMRTDLGVGHTRLRPPVVVTPAALPLYDQRTIKTAYKIAVRRQSPAEVNRHFARSKLGPPRVVTAAVTQIFFGPQITYWAAVKSRMNSKGQRRDTRYFLRPPILPVSTQIFFGPKVFLNVMLPEIRRTRVTRRSPDYELKPPVVIGAGIAWHGPGVYLTRPKQPLPAKSILHAPAVVTPVTTQIFFGPRVTLSVMLPERLRSTVTRRSPDYELRPPLVLAENLPTQVTLAPSRRLQVKSRLSPPAVVAPVVSYGPDVHLTYSRRGAPKPQLKPPTDVIGLEDQGRVQTHLAPSRRGRPLSRLSPPTALQVNGEIDTTFAPQRRGLAKSRLSPPAVITAVVTEAFYGPQTWLTYSRRGKTLPGLGRLIVVSEGPHGGVMQSLTPSSRGRARSALRNYVVAAVVVQTYYGPSVHLTRIRPRRIQFFLRPPVIPPLARPIDTALAPQRRGRTRNALAPPRVVFLAVEISGPEQWLTYSRRGQPKSTLRPPVVLASNLPTVTTFAPQRRGAPKSHLSPPVVVFLAVEIYGPVVALTRIKPAPTIALLRPPTDITEAEEFPIERVHLAYSRRGVARYFLRPFTTGAFDVYAGPTVTLTPSRRPVTKSELRPPTVVAPVVSYGPFQWLTYSRRGTPKPELRPPTVVAVAVIIRYATAVHLTYSRRGRPIYRLRPPTRVFPVLFYGPQITLRPQVRGIPKSILRAPRVVRLAVEIYGPVVELTYSRRPITHSELLPPTVVEKFLARPTQTLLARITHPPVEHVLKPPTVVRLAVEIYGPEQWLTYSRRPKTASQLFPGITGKAPFRGILVSLAPSRYPRPQYKLRPPAVILRPVFETHLELTYSRRGQPKSLLKQPTVIHAVFYPRPVQIHLTRITPPPVEYLLKPPSVVGAGIAFYGPVIHLTRIKHPPVHYVLRLTLVAFRRPHGDVCGFDIAGSFVCSLEVPGSQVSGSTSTRFGISGSSRAGSTMSGSEEPGGSVSGSDRKAT